MVINYKHPSLFCQQILRAAWVPTKKRPQRLASHKTRRNDAASVPWFIMLDKPPGLDRVFVCNFSATCEEVCPWGSLPKGCKNRIQLVGTAAGL